MKFPDETGKRLVGVDEQHSRLEMAWNSHEFVGLAVEVRNLKQECDEFLAWAEEEIQHSGGSNADKGS